MKNCQFNFYPELIRDGNEPAIYSVKQKQVSSRIKQIDVQAFYEGQGTDLSECSFTFFLLKIKFMEYGHQNECWTLFGKS